MDVTPKIGVWKTPPNWMVDNNGKPYEQMDDLGVPLFFGNTHISVKRREESPPLKNS